MNHRNSFIKCTSSHRKSYSSTSRDQRNSTRAKRGHYNFTTESHRCIFFQLPAGELQEKSWSFFYRVTFIIGPRCDRVPLASQWESSLRRRLQQRPLLALRNSPLYKVLWCLDTHAVSAKEAFTPSRGAHSFFFLREPAVVGRREKIQSAFCCTFRWVLLPR